MRSGVIKFAPITRLRFRPRAERFNVSGMLLVPEGLSLPPKKIIAGGCGKFGAQLLGPRAVYSDVGEGIVAGSGVEVDGATLTTLRHCSIGQ